MFLVSFSLGGLSFTLYYYTNFYEIFGITTKIFKQNFSIKILLIASGISYVVIKLINNWYKNSIKKCKLIYNIKIINEKKEIKLKGYYDTGNELKNTVIIEYDKIKDILDEEIIKILDEKIDILNALATINLLGIEKIKIIPFTSLGNENDLLLGFKPDEFYIEINDKYTLKKNIIIGICNFKLNNNDEYNALLNKNILNLED